MPSPLETESRQILDWRNADQPAKHSIEMCGAQAGYCSQVIERKYFMKVAVHGLDRTFNRLSMSANGYIPCADSAATSEHIRWHCIPSLHTNVPYCALLLSPIQGGNATTE